MKNLAFVPPTAVKSAPAAASSTSVSMAADVNSSRREFMKKSVGAASAATFGFFVNFDGHSPNCQCSSCGGGHEAGCDCATCADNHSLGCQCGNCVRYGPLSAVAYDRDVGDDNRSADTYAFNLQARKTNARLEASGFKLDTKEEEEARLSDAFSSFSYDSNVAVKGQKSNVGKGYGNKTPISGTFESKR